MKKNKVSIGIAAALAALFGEATAVQAQEKSSAVLQEIVVEARRRSESLQDAPLSITALTEDSLKDLGVDDIKDISKFSPGLNIEGGVDNNTSRFFIRGVGTATPTFGTESSVPIYIDDVYTPLGLGSNIDIFSVERVEVLSGPQGTLYGRNSFGGAIKIYSKGFSDETEGSVSYTVGRFGQRDVKGELRTPLIEDKLFLGLAGASIQNDGIQELINVPGARGWSDDKELYRVRLEARPSDKLTFKFSYEDNDDQGFAKNQKILPGSNSNGNAVINSDDFIGAYNVVALDLGLDPLPLLTPIPILGPSEIDEIEADSVSRSVVEQQSYTFSATYEINDNMTVKYLGSNREQNNIRAFDIDGGPVPFFVVREQFEFEAESHEFRFEYGNDRLNVAAGLFFYEEDTDVHQIFNNPFLLPVVTEALRTGMTTDGNPFNPTIPVQTLLDVQGNPSSLNVGVLLNQHVQNTESQAAYANVSYNFTDALRVSAGIRYTKDDKVVDTPVGNFDQAVTTILNPVQIPHTGNIIPNAGLNGEFFTDILNGPNTVGFNFPDGVMPGDPGVDSFGDVGTISDSFDELTFELTVDFDLTEDVLLYSSFKQGFQAGLITPNGTARAVGLPLEAAPQSTDAQKIDALEIGFKSTLLDGRWQLNGAAYWYDWSDIILFTNIQVDDLVLAAGGEIALVTNAGEATTFGVELDSRFAITENLQVYGNVAFHDFSLDSVEGFDQDSGQNTNIVDNFNDSVTVATPDFKGLVGIEYFQPIGSGELRLWSNVAYRDEIGTNNRSQSQSGGLNILNATDNEEAFTSRSHTNVSAGITYTNNNWRVDLVGSNLLDERRVESTIFDDGFVGRGQQYNKPRTWYLTAEYSF